MKGNKNTGKHYFLRFISMILLILSLVSAETIAESSRLLPVVPDADNLFAGHGNLGFQRLVPGGVRRRAGGLVRLGRRCPRQSPKNYVPCRYYPIRLSLCVPAAPARSHQIRPDVYRQNRH